MTAQGQQATETGTETGAPGVSHHAQVWAFSVPYTWQNTPFLGISGREWNSGLGAQRGRQGFCGEEGQQGEGGSPDQGSQPCRVWERTAQPPPALLSRTLLSPGKSLARLRDARSRGSESQLHSQPSLPTMWGPERGRPAAGRLPLALVSPARRRRGGRGSAGGVRSAPARESQQGPGG